LAHDNQSLPITVGYSLRHIGHTNNGFFKLVEVLLQIHSGFFSSSIKLRGLSLYYLPKMSQCNSHMPQNAS